MSGGLRHGFVFLTLGQVVFILTGYATHIFLARSLGPAAYGTYGVLLSVLSTVCLVLTTGIPEAIAKFAAEKPLEAGGIFARGIALQFRFSLLLAVGYALLSPIIARALHDPSLTLELCITALAVPSVALYAVVLGALNGQHRFFAQALVVGGYGAARALLIIGLSPAFHIWGAVIGFVVAPLIAIVFSLPSILKNRSVSELDSRAIWLFARPVIAFTLALAFLMNLDLFIVKSLISDPDLIGFYAAAGTIAKVPYFFFSALGVVLLPIVSSAAGEVGGQVLGAVRNAIRLTFAVALGVAAVAVPLAPAVLELLYGQRYTASALPLSLLIVANTFYTLTFIVSYALNGLGKPALAMRLGVIGLVIQAVAALLLTRLFGPVGAASASCAGGALVLSALVLASRPHLGAIFPLRSLLRVALSGSLVVIVGLVLPHRHAAALLCSVPLALGYVMLLILSGEMSLSELASWVRRTPA